MDMVFIVWAIVASILFVAEVGSHRQTRAAFLRYRTQVALERTIDDHAMQHLKPVKEIEHKSKEE